jgi:hypothetical protein
MKSIFELIGIITCIVVAVFIVGLVFMGVKSFFEKLHREHIYKHRFDKPPIAKCYCIDCKKHGKDGRCCKFDRWITADNWFCWDAEPCERGNNHVK